MNCYQHENKTAVGTCKACCKSVCTECLIDTGNGLACSEPCKKEVLEMNQIIETSKKVYGIGDYSRKELVPAGAMVYVFFAMLFLGWSAYEYFSIGKIDTFPIVMGVGFLVMGVYSYIKMKKYGIGC